MRRGRLMRGWRWGGGCVRRLPGRGGGEARGPRRGCGWGGGGEAGLLGGGWGGRAGGGVGAERAVRLGTDVAARPGRLAAAAEAAAEGGDFGRARELAARGAAVSGDPVAVARLACVRARAEVAEGRLLAAHRLLAEGA